MLCEKIINLERDMTILLQYARSLQPKNKHYNLNENLCDSTSDSLDTMTITKRKSEQKTLIEVIRDPVNEQTGDNCDAPEPHKTLDDESVHLQVAVSTENRHGHTNHKLPATTTTSASPVQIDPDSIHMQTKE